MFLELPHIQEHGKCYKQELPLLYLSIYVLFYTLVIYYIDQGVSNVNQLIDTTPTPNWILLGSKFLALIKMQLILVSLVMISGILFQI